MSTKTENSQKNKLWKFVNSNFGLWLLSTVFIGIITFSYTKLNESISDNSNRKELIIKLDQEIEGRFYQLVSKQKRQRDSINEDYEFEVLSGQETMKELWFQFKASPEGHYQGLYVVYPEFSERNIASLIIELSSLIDNKDESEKVKKVAHRILSNELLPLYLKNNIELEEFLVDVNSQLRLKRWRKYWPKR